MSDDTAEALRQQKAIDDAFYAELDRRGRKLSEWTRIAGVLGNAVKCAGPNSSIPAFLVGVGWATKLDNYRRGMSD